MTKDGTPMGNAAKQGVKAQVRAGVEGAAPALAGQAPGHIDRLRVRLPRGASVRDISDAIAKAARRSKGPMT